MAEDDLTFETFNRLAHALVLARLASSGSLGQKVSSGIKAARAVMCWPLPLPISSTWPDLPSSALVMIAEIGSMLR